jgi:hypothetical protein
VRIKSRIGNTDPPPVRAGIGIVGSAIARGARSN